MENSRPFLILAAVVGVAVLAALILSRMETAPEIDRESVVAPAPSPTPTPVERIPEAASTQRIDPSSVHTLYDALQQKINDYSTAQVRVRFEMPDFLPRQKIEAEVRFDAMRPDRWVKEITASRSKDKSDPNAEWEVIPTEGHLVDGTLFRDVEHQERNVVDTDLSDTHEGLSAYLNKKKEEVADQFEDPLTDLLFGMPFEDRFPEIVRAEIVETEEGKETRVLFRINSEMARQMKAGNGLRPYFDICSDCVKDVSLREDVFDAESGTLKRTVYRKVDEQVFIVQHLLEVVWDEDIPDNRFELELPVPARMYNLNRVLKHKLTLPTYEESVKQMEEGSVDWDTLVKRAQDY